MKRTYTNKTAIIHLLRRGEMICCRSVEHFGRRNQLVYAAKKYSVTDGESSRLIHSSTISAMIRNGIINGPDQDKSICYKLITK